MKNYCIGIIDENTIEILDIQRTIIANKPNEIPEEAISFSVFSFDGDPNKLINDLYEKAIESIARQEIDALLVDYKIIIEESQIEGTELFRKVSESVPKFPLVLLTNVPESCYEKSFVDADKVYSKREFLKLEQPLSKEKVNNLFRNITNYRDNKERLLAFLAESKSRYEANEQDDEAYMDIVKIDIELDEYLPQGKSIVEKGLDLSNLREAVGLIQEASEIIGE